MIPDDVKEAFRGFAPAGERLELAVPAGDGWVYLSSRAIYAGRPLVRVPRAEIASVEIAERALLILGEHDERARTKFTGPQRAAMLEISNRLSPTKKRLELEFAKARTGGLVEGSVHLEWPKKGHVRGVHVHLLGEEEWEGKSRRFLSGSKCLFGGPPVDPSRVLEELTEPIAWPVLRKGRHAWPFRFRIPRSAPPTVAGVIRYRLQGHVDLPLAFDLVAEEELDVALPPIDPPAALRERGDSALHLRVRPVDFAQGWISGEVRLENRSGPVEIRLLADDATVARTQVARGAFRLPMPRNCMPYRAHWSSQTLEVEARAGDLTATVPL